MDFLISGDYVQCHTLVVSKTTFFCTIILYPPRAGDEKSHSALATASSELPDLLKFSEVKGDLFSCPPTSSLAHCVSEDMAMGKGVAVLFKKEFGGVGELRAQGKAY